MRAVIQRVKNCSVHVNKRLCGQINNGLLVYLGVGKQDSPKDSNYILDKITHLRIFQDQEGKMNLSVKDLQAEILVVSQFTLFGDTQKGRRPSYSKAAEPEKAKEYYNKLIVLLRNEGFKVESGEFGAMMEVNYTNSGPVTILVDSEKRI